MDQGIISKVAQLLNQGVPEEEIIQGMVEAKIPQEVAQQAIAEAKQSLGGGKEPGRPEGVRQNSEGMAIIRRVITDIGPEKVLLIIEAIMKMDGGELNALADSLRGGSSSAMEEQGSGQQGQPQQQSGGTIPANLEV